MRRARMSGGRRDVYGSVLMMKLCWLLLAVVVLIRYVGV